MTEITINPANEKETTTPNRQRIPMSVPRLKLTTPLIPGYHLHWMLGTEARLAQAQQAGYTFVDNTEIGVNNFDVAGDLEDSGNTDLGTRISIVAGGDSDGTNAVRQYLMKIPNRFWEEDQKLIADRNEQTAAALRGGDDIEGQGYIPKSHRKQVANLFKRKN